LEFEVEGESEESNEDEEEVVEIEVNTIVVVLCCVISCSHRLTVCVCNNSCLLYGDRQKNLDFVFFFWDSPEDTDSVW
jgi:hypothetical protein